METKTNKLTLEKNAMTHNNEQTEIETCLADLARIKGDIRKSIERLEHYENLPVALIEVQFELDSMVSLFKGSK